MSRPLLIAALLAGACSASPNAASSAPVQADSATLPFTVTEQGKFDTPFAVTFLPDSRILVTEKKGKLKLRATDGSVSDVGGVPAVAYGGQGGLLDIEIAPDFAKSHVVYLSYSEPRPTGSSLALARATLKEGAAPSLEGLEVIFRAGSDGAGGQFGGNIAFSPDGKLLYLSSGERQRFTPAQDPDQALGKILRLTLDGKPAPGNPDFAAGGVRAETWSTGHRNPYGLAFARDGRLWEIEMGPKGGDEVNLILPGRNYGWPKASNGDNYDGTPIPDHTPGDGFEAPKVFWNPSISPGGLMIYSGKMFPAWQGSAFIAALSGQALIRVTLDGDKAAKADQWGMGARIRDVAQAPDGAIWLLEDGRGGTEGQLIRLTPK
ncbi:MAG: PQQ-dependent sugar dehydrogenase [Sphingomonas bacterium]|jgi:glucose/arabinose dehydrogenase|uniref:PQQ-dependent sugar dehydrogenase n=1 Tax=Sphingomonas bacterium TaxID=1895847 RepID=UPI00261A05D2|nr:PQQ-dependent sugar dehydrogenase [Sphingomonas bacterium]MDB5703545.1 PQQ-dependent sugar dehydrogenase [Sphingomonas bacterium]